MNEQVREIVRNACMQYASAYRADQLGGSVRARIVDVFTAEIAAIMPKPLDKDAIVDIVRRYSLEDEIDPFCIAVEIAARFCAPDSYKQNIIQAQMRRHRRDVKRIAELEARLAALQNWKQGWPRRRNGLSWVRRQNKNRGGEVMLNHKIGQLIAEELGIDCCKYWTKPFLVAVLSRVKELKSTRTPDPAAVLKQVWEKLIPTTSPFSDDGYDRAFAAGIRAGINFSKEIIEAKIKELEE